jgi:hypothetical protein
MCAAWFNTKRPYTLPTLLIEAFLLILRINSDYFPQLVGLYNADAVFPLR